MKTFRDMLDMKASVNFYVFFGGTNFGFTAGQCFSFATSTCSLTSE